jgi:hypothetical protein
MAVTGKFQVQPFDSGAMAAQYAMASHNPEGTTSPTLYIHNMIASKDGSL